MSLDQATENAKAGQLALHLDPEQFDQIIKACDVYIDGLSSLQHDAETLGMHPLGFSEANLTSGHDLSERFQQKASGSAASTFRSHIERVREMQALFRALRANYQTSDQGNASSFNLFGR